MKEYCHKCGSPDLVTNGIMAKCSKCGWVLPDDMAERVFSDSPLRALMDHNRDKHNARLQQTLCGP